MTLVSTPGLVYPPLRGNVVNLFHTTGVIDATGEKLSMLGRVWWPGFVSGTKNIDKVAFRFGSVTKAGGSGLTVSLQDVDLANGPPGRPDEVQDQTAAIANGDANFASSTWYTTASLSAQRTVAFGERLAVVIEYDGSGRLGADSVVISLPIMGDGTESVCSLKTGGSWSNIASTEADVLLLFSDGSFGTITDSFVASSISIYQYNNGSNPDERANKITVPFACTCEGLLVNTNPNVSTATTDIVLYDSDGTTVLDTISIDPNAVTLVNSYGFQRLPLSAPISLDAGQVVYVSVKPTSNISINLPFYEVADAAHWEAHWTGDENWYYSSRVDGGAWADTTTRRIQASLILSEIDNGAGSGGGLLVNPGMRGGMI